jgi:hypothetical protein
MADDVLKPNRYAYRTEDNRVETITGRVRVHLAISDLTARCTVLNEQVGPCLKGLRRAAIGQLPLQRLLTPERHHRRVLRQLSDGNGRRPLCANEPPPRPS